MRGYIENMPYVTWKEKRNKKTSLQKKILLILGCLIILMATFSSNADSDENVSVATNRVDIGYQG